MTVMIKKHVDRTTLKILGAVATLAALTAIVNVSNFCIFWFHQPEMPDDVRNMTKD